MKNNTKRIGLLFDSIRSPYDIANIIQVTDALDCDIYTSGNCIDFQNRKIVNKLTNWGMIKYPNIIHFNTIEEAINEFHKQGKKVYGTSPHATSDFYNIDINKEDIIIAFGNESKGFSKKAMEKMDDVTFIPMKNLNFLTLPIAVSAVAFELNRQLNNEKNS